MFAGTQNQLLFERMNPVSQTDRDKLRKGTLSFDKWENHDDAMYALSSNCFFFFGPLPFLNKKRRVTEVVIGIRA